MTNPRDKVNQALQEGMQILNRTMARACIKTALALRDHVLTFRTMAMTDTQKEMFEDVAERTLDVLARFEQLKAHLEK